MVLGPGIYIQEYSSFLGSSGPFVFCLWPYNDTIPISSGGLSDTITTAEQNQVEVHHWYFSMDPFSGFRKVAFW